jgi:hypothetical protein
VSATEDFAIAKLMLARGFRPQLVWEHFAQNLLHPQYIPPEIRNGDGFQRLAGLRLFTAVVQRKLFEKEEAITVEQLETAAIALNPGIVRYERIYEDMVGSLDCSDAASCFAKTKQLRDAIGFREIVVKNPSTGKFE